MLLSVIILTFNSRKFIKPCLDSVYDYDYNHFEVIVVDNGSKDNTADFVKKKYPQVLLIENKKNLGACRARNQGIDVSSGKWVLTLDCDVVLGSCFLSKVLEAINNVSPEVGMIQPKILTINKKAIYSCGIYLSRLLRRFYDVGKGKGDSEQFNKAKYIFGGCSAATIYRRKMLEEIREGTGYFDERFFFLLEDVDLAWRAQGRGWKALYYPKAVSYHYGNSSSFNKTFRQFLCWRNRNLMLKKHRMNVFRLAIIYLIYDLPRMAFLVLTNPYLHNSFCTSMHSRFPFHWQRINR